MKSTKINSLLAIGFVTGLFVAGSVNSTAQGIQPPSIRDCARQMCFMLRNCNQEVPEKVKKPESTRSSKVDKANPSNDTQGFSAESCRQWSYMAYLQCSEGGFNGVKPQDKVKPADTKK